MRMLSRKVMAVAYLAFGVALINFPQAFPVPPGGFSVGSPATGKWLTALYLGLSSIGGIAFVVMGLVRLFRGGASSGRNDG